jgi:predicted nucleic acid-binding protein
LATVDRKDSHHRTAQAISERLLAGRYRLVTTMYVVVETHASLLRAMNPGVARQFLDYGLDGITVLSVSNEDEDRARELLLRRTDKDYSYCDAISFTVMERLGLRLAFAFDDHFRQHGLSTPLDHGDWP